MMELELLRAALLSGAVEWEYDNEAAILRAFYPENYEEGLLYTAFWVEEDDCGDIWVRFRTVYSDGYTQTTAGTCGLIN